MGMREVFSILYTCTHHNHNNVVKLDTLPSASRMCNEEEADLWRLDMYAEHVYFSSSLLPLTSLVPMPLPDFILQPWRKIGRRPGTITTSRAGNGGLDSYVMWTRFHNDGNVPTQCAASTASD